MDLNQRKEQFSNAYIRAVAAVAGYTIYKPEVDDDSIDCGLAGRGGCGTRRSPRLEMQLKCSAMDILYEECIKFKLPVKNFNELCPDNFIVPRILVIVLVPARIDDWLLHSETTLALSHCGYWVSLRGQAPTCNDESITVNIPRTQRFSVTALEGLMERIRHGDHP